jgi:hypothetical protein
MGAQQRAHQGAQHGRNKDAQWAAYRCWMVRRLAAVLAAAAASSGAGHELHYTNYITRTTLRAGAQRPRVVVLLYHRVRVVVLLYHRCRCSSSSVTVQGKMKLGGVLARAREGKQCVLA